MDFKKASASYKDLKKQLQKKKITEAQFSERAAQLQIQDETGTWWHINQTDGSWLMWDGTGWVRRVPTDKNQTFTKQKGSNASSAPQTLVQLLVFFIKSLVKSIPKMVFRALIIGIMVWIAHAYLLVVINNGYLKISSWAADILAIKWSGHNNVAKATLFWTIFGWLASYVVFVRILGNGPTKFIKDIALTPGWVIKGFKQLGKRNIGVLLIILAIGIITNVIIKNVYLSCIVAVAFFLILTSRYEGLMYIVVKLAHSDWQRIFQSKKPAKPFNDGYLIVFLTGIILGVLVYLFLPFRPYSAYLATALLLGAGVYLMVNTRSVAVSMLFSMYVGLNIIWFLATGASAHDGGWDEYGRDFGTWWVSQGRNESVAAGTLPSIGAAAGAAVGGATGAGIPSSSDITASQPDSTETTNSESKEVDSAVGKDGVFVSPNSLGGPLDNPNTVFNGSPDRC